MLKPIAKSEWGPEAAAHLLNRTGFGATPAESDRAAARRPEEVVDELLALDPARETFDMPTWVGPDANQRPNFRALRGLSEEERRRKQQEQRREEFQRIGELRAWWLYRMRYAKQPLAEKLTLFWHGHFATSLEKVRSAYCLYRQNQTFRTHAAGNWRDLLIAVSQDPAMLIYLDNAQSRRQQPNENYARELMELFTLGEGHYTEDDIKQAARAFTGWSIAFDRFAFEDRPLMHDPGEKTFFGETGPFTGREIVDIILRQPPAARFIARKLWVFFGHDHPSDELVETLAGVLRAAKYELKPLLRAMFLSREFYAAETMRTQIKSPVVWLVGTARRLEAPLPGGFVSSSILRTLGQELFAPPNVKGWDGGYAWITTARLLTRYNLAELMTKGGREALAVNKDVRMEGARGLESIVDAEKILPASARTSREAVLQALAWRLYSGPVRDKDQAALKAYLAAHPEPAQWTAREVRDVLAVMMSTPQYQLT
jgi:uncharacterized protein (DUF1800 family)